MDKIKADQQVATFIANVPQEIATMGSLLNSAHKRVAKARLQLGLWEEELASAGKEFELRQEEYYSLSKRWDVESSTIKPKLETLS